MIIKNLLRTGIAVGIVLAGLGAVPTGAQAVTCGVSGATTVTGIGAKLQRTAQLAWGAELLAPDPGGPNATGFGYLDLFNAITNPTGHGCAAAAIGGTTAVRYEPADDSAGRRAFGASTVLGQAGVRNTSYAFGGVTEPPTTAEISAANDGANGVVGGGDDAVLHTIPVAQAAIAVVVKLPANCTVAASATQRRISRSALVAAFGGTATTWSAVLPSATLTGAGCSAAVERVVPSTSSGTTFAFKDYLRAIDPSFPASNAVWPNDSGSTAAVRATHPLDDLNARANGGIAFADLATARDRGFDWQTGVTANSDRTFWLYVERSTGTYASPAVSNNAGATGVNRAANCATTEYVDIASGSSLPSGTTQSWNEVRSIEWTGGYSLCALTYALAWERPSLANVGSLQPPITLDQAQTVRDYLGFVVEDKNGLNGTPRAGQSQLAVAGYQKLPEAVRALAVSGVTSLNW